jgi:glutathione S-transferase
MTVPTMVDEAETVAVAAAEPRAAGQPVTLVQFPRVWGRNVSPFGLKLETWLRLADVPFYVRESVRLDKAPKGKLPFIVDAGLVLGDTTLIVEHLKDTRGLDPDAGLSPRECAEALALQRLFEDHLYFVIAYSRWLDDEAFPLVAEAFFARVPAPARPMMRAMARRRVARMLHLQGLGRHSRDEIYAMGRQDLAAVSAFLEDRPFFMGERLSTVDAIAYGCLANILLVPLETELKRAAQSFPNLVTFCESIEQGLEGEG